jgi:hypothetical protein
LTLANGGALPPDRAHRWRQIVGSQHRGVRRTAISYAGPAVAVVVVRVVVQAPAQPGGEP